MVLALAQLNAYNNIVIQPVDLITLLFLKQSSACVCVCVHD